MTLWILVGLVAWCVLAAVVGVAIGAVVERRDRGVTGSRVPPKRERTR
jgi:hypothetical protein